MDVQRRYSGEGFVSIYGKIEDGHAVYVSLFRANSAESMKERERLKRGEYKVLFSEGCLNYRFFLLVESYLERIDGGNLPKKITLEMIFEAMEVY